MNYAHSL